MLVNDFPPLSVGGAERQAERLAVYMAEQGFTTGVLTRHVGNLPRKEERDNFTVYRLSQFGPGKFKTITFTIAALIKLIQLRSSYDVLHAHLAFAPAIAAAVAGRLLGKQVIVKFGNSSLFGDVERSRQSVRGRVRLTILRRWVNMIVTLDSEMEQEALGAGFARQHVIRMDNGIDTHDFQPVPPKTTAKRALDLDRKIVAVYTGRFTRQKALPNLLQAMRLACDSCPELHLLLVGQGEDESTLRALARELNLDTSVTFEKSVDDIRPYLHAADIFILPSLAEGISNSLLEAMACGLACITTCVGGSADVLGHGECGILVQPDQIDQLADALIRLTHNEDERNNFAKKARQRIVDRYSIQTVGRTYVDLYNSLMVRS